MTTLRDKPCVVYADVSTSMVVGQFRVCIFDIYLGVSVFILVYRHLFRCISFGVVIFIFAYRNLVLSR